MPPRRRTPKVRRADVMSELQSRLLGDIGRAMKQRGVTNRELRAAGAPTQQAINKWQHGSSPKLESLEAIAAALESRLLVAIPGVSEAGVSAPADGTTEGSPAAAGPTPSKQAAYLMGELDAIRDEGARQQALVRCLTALSEAEEARPKKKPRPKQAQPRGSTRVRWTAGGGAR